MLKSSLFTLFLILFTISVKAQDVIVLKDGTKIDAKIVEITTTSIKYYKFEQQEGPIRILEKYEITEIIYANGDSEKFDVPAPQIQKAQEAPSTMRPEKPIKDPILQRGFFIDGLIGFSQYRRTNIFYYSNGPEISSFQAAVVNDNYFSLGMRLGSKWYFGKNEKWRPGFQATWLRFTMHVAQEEDILIGPRTISIANVGMCNVFKFSDKLAMEANFVVGPSMSLDFDDGNFGQGFALSIETKLRLNSYAFGIDYQYSNLADFSNNSRDIFWHNLALTVGRKF